jgi:hypothetical protein
MRDGGCLANTKATTEQNNTRMMEKLLFYTTNCISYTLNKNHADIASKIKLQRN